MDNEARITLGLLNMVHDNEHASQRSMADGLGIALGLANAYLKRCVKKGLIKISHAPANRYAYYLTPQGFSEKSRLTAEFLSQSFNLFRHARTAGADLFGTCQARGWTRVALFGAGDLAAQTTQVMQNLGLALKAAGASYSNIVKITTFVVGYRPELRPIIGKARSAFFEGMEPPASTLVGVTALAAPEWLIEIEAIAVAD